MPRSPQWSPSPSFPTKTLYTPSPHPYAPHPQPISFFSILSPAQYWVSSTNHLSPRYAISSIPPLPHGTTFWNIRQSSRFVNFDSPGRNNTCMTSSWYIALPIELSCLSSSHSWGTHCSGVPCCNHAPNSGISWIRWDSFLNASSLQA